MLDSSACLFQMPFCLNLSIDDRVFVFRWKSQQFKSIERLWSIGEDSFKVLSRRSRTQSDYGLRSLGKTSQVQGHSQIAIDWKRDQGKNTVKSWSVGKERCFQYLAKKVKARVQPNQDSDPEPRTERAYSNYDPFENRHWHLIISRARSRVCLLKIEHSLVYYMSKTQSNWELSTKSTCISFHAKHTFKSSSSNTIYLAFSTVQLTSCLKSAHQKCKPHSADENTYLNPNHSTRD